MYTLWELAHLPSTSSLIQHSSLVLGGVLDSIPSVSTNFKNIPQPLSHTFKESSNDGHYQLNGGYMYQGLEKM
jgi:hypothetical protein